MKKLKPNVCPIDLILAKLDLGNFPNFTSAGFMMPCCWLDHMPQNKKTMLICGMKN